MEIHRTRPLYRPPLKEVSFSVTCIVLEHKFPVCVHVLTYSIHMLRSLFFVSTEVAERQQQCPGLTQKTFAANELIHQQKCVGTGGWWGGGGGWRGRWRETVGRSRGPAEAGPLRKKPHIKIWWLWHFRGLQHLILSFWMLQLEDLSSAWSCPIYW